MVHLNFLGWSAQLLLSGQNLAGFRNAARVSETKVSSRKLDSTMMASWAFFKEKLNGQGNTNPAFSKPCLFPSDTRHFRHFRRFRGSKERNPCFQWVEMQNSPFSPFSSKRPLFGRGQKHGLPKNGLCHPEMGVDPAGGGGGGPGGCSNYPDMSPRLSSFVLFSAQSGDKSGQKMTLKTVTSLNKEARLPKFRFFLSDNSIWGR